MVIFMTETGPIEPTPGTNGGIKQSVESEPAKPELTPEGGIKASEPTKPEISPEIQALIDKVVTDRLGREKRGHEKEKAALQREKDELAKKIAEYEEKDLGELDKLQKKIERLTKDLADKDQVLSDKDLRILKMESLLTAGATPDQVPKLLKRLSGTTQEEVEADIEELKSMGWIGKPPETQATTPKPAAQGSGHPQVPDKGLKKFTQQQIKSMSTDEYSANRADIMKSLNAGLVA